METIFFIDSVTLEKGRRKNAQTILSDFSLEAQRGECVVLRGASGCGKTTLASSLEGFLAPSAGTVSFCGEDIYRFSSKQMAHYRNQSVGMVFQFFNLVPHMTALENVMAPALIAGASKTQAEQSARELLVRVGLGEKAGLKAMKLSGGQQQRVAVARALINHPVAIIADEPTANLDRESAELVGRELWRYCREQGGTLLAITHNDIFEGEPDKEVLLESYRNA